MYVDAATARTWPVRCCGTSVGAVVYRTTPTGEREYLLIRRKWWPLGRGPVAGHVKDQFATAEEALHGELAEEVNLKPVSYAHLFSVRLPNLCQSPPALPESGHDWDVFEVQAEGDLQPDPEETNGADWVPLPELLAAAEITVRHALLGLPARTLPPEGLEAVWGELFHRAGVLEFTTAERAALRTLYTTEPDEFWVD